MSKGRAPEASAQSSQAIANAVAQHESRRRYVRRLSNRLRQKRQRSSKFLFIYEHWMWCGRPKRTAFVDRVFQLSELDELERFELVAATLDFFKKEERHSPYKGCIGTSFSTYARAAYERISTTANAVCECSEKLIAWANTTIRELERLRHQPFDSPRDRRKCIVDREALMEIESISLCAELCQVYDEHHRSIRYHHWVLRKTDFDADAFEREVLDVSRQHLAARKQGIGRVKRRK